MKYLKKILCLLVVLLLVACHPTTEQLEKEVKTLASEKFAEVGIRVVNVTLIHKGGNDYSGIITLSSEGESEEFDINVVCDGRNFQYEIPAFNY